MNIKSFSQKLGQFSLLTLLVAISARYLISLASWFRFFSAFSLWGNPLKQAAWQTSHGNALLNWMHSIWLYKHAAFAIAMHWATFFMGVFALLFAIIVIVNIAVRVFSNNSAE